MKCTGLWCALIMLISAAAASAEEPFTGWTQTRTDNFVIIYEEKDEQAAGELTTFCEDVYQQVTEFVGSIPEGPIHCVLRSRFDIATAYSFSPPAHIVLYLTPPKDHDFGVREESWLRILLTHELVHYVHSNYDRGLYYLLSRIFGREMRYMDGFFLTAWLTEGIAVSAETLFTKAGRGDSPFFELLYKAPVLENSLFSARRAGYSSDYPPSGRQYIAGYLLISYIRSVYGDEALREMLLRFSRFPFFGFSRTVKKTIGKSYPALFADMSEALADRFGEDAAIPHGRTMVPQDYGDYYHPHLKEGSLVVYRETLKDYPAVVSLDPRTGEESILIPIRLADPYSFSLASDGTVVFAATDADGVHPAGQTLVSDLYIQKPEQTRPVRLTRGASVWHPVFSSDGTRLIAVQGVGTYSRLVEVDVSSGDITVLFETDGAVMYTPALSPDSSTVAFTMLRDGMQDIWLLDLDSCGKGVPAAAPLFRPDSHGDYYPRFIDETTLLFTSDREGRLSLYRMAIGASHMETAAVDPVGAFSGTLDGNRVIYGTYTSLGYSIKEKALKPGAVIAVEPSDLRLEWGGDDTLYGDISSRRYRDIPRPLFWFPYPLAAVNASAPLLSFGAGVYTAGSSILNTWQWSLLVGSRFEIFQPEINLEISLKIRSVGINYALEQSYVNSSVDSFTQSTTQNLEVEIPFISRVRLGRISYLASTVGIQHLYSLTGTTGFSIIESADRPDLTSSTFVLGTAGIAGYAERQGSAFDLYPRLFFGGSLRGALPLYPAAAAGTGVALYGQLIWSFPSFIRHQAVKLAVQSEFSSIAAVSYSQVQPRGFFSDVWGNDRGRYLAAVDYLIPLALLDAPLILGFNLQGIGMGLHLETLGGWDLSPGRFVPIRDLYTGIEFSFILGSTFFDRLPVGFGVSFRFDTTFTEKPDLLLNDLMPYFFIGLDSLSGFFLNSGDAR